VVKKVNVIQVLPGAVFRALVQAEEIALGFKPKEPVGLRQPNVPIFSASFLWERLGQEVDCCEKTFSLPFASAIFPLAKMAQSELFSGITRKNGVVRNGKGQIACLPETLDKRATALGRVIVHLQNYGRQRQFRAA
jgi:hypothetical protein